MEAETSLDEYKRQLADARNDASQIIEEARLQADSVRQERIAAVDGEIAELRARAAEDIRLATQRAMSDLQGRVAELSIELAEKVVERNLDRQTQTALIESYINQVGSN
jgi:F-type H+-transporting ATPase subunit b